MKDPFITAKPFPTLGGVKLPHRKYTAGKDSVVMPPPSTVVIPLQMHIGAPCEPLVKVGDEVMVGQEIGESNAPFSAPIHASVSGKVTAIKEIETVGGRRCMAVHIASDGKMTPATLTPPEIHDRASFLDAVRECGLVGLGGAAFPTHIKLNVPEGKNVDTLLINVAECEPYLTSDDRTVMEDTWDVMSGIYAIKQYLDIHRVLICVESNKPEAIRVLKSIVSSSANEDKEVQILPLRASYPQGAEKVLIKAATGREVPAGKLPADAGCIVMNVTSVAKLSIFLKTGMPLVSKRVTVAGEAVERPQNVIVPIGTSVKDILDFCGLKHAPAKILLGGPMMGMALADTDVPIQKGTNGIIAMHAKEAFLDEPSACIRCGRCMNACPMRLSPLMLERAVTRRDTEDMAKQDILSCMECGCCAYTCPAKRPLVQAIRLGKTILRETAAKK